MSRQFSQPINWQNREQLRIATAALCLDLCRELARFDAGGIGEAWLKEVYESVYQERTVELMDALLRYAPADWGLTVVRTPMGHRIFKPPDDITADPWAADLAATQLGTLIWTLETLASHVSEH